jgi:hypothetical protein
MGFVAIAVGISIDVCGRQAMPTAGYAYPEICSIKTTKNELHFTQLI